MVNIQHPVSSIQHLASSIQQSESPCSTSPLRAHPIRAAPQRAILATIVDARTAKLQYLSKSDYKIARSCPTKLYYRKSHYPSALDADPYLERLADGIDELR